MGIGEKERADFAWRGEVSEEYECSGHVWRRGGAVWEIIQEAVVQWQSSTPRRVADVARIAGARARLAFVIDVHGDALAALRQQLRLRRRQGRSRQSQKLSRNQGNSAETRGTRPDRATSTTATQRNDLGRQRRQRGKSEDEGWDCRGQRTAGRGAATHSTCTHDRRNEAAGSRAPDLL